MVSLGETLSYFFTVTNEGNVSLSALTVSDQLPGLSEVYLISGDSNGNGDLDPTEIWNYAATYEVTQNDLDLGKIYNEAEVSVFFGFDSVRDDTNLTVLICQSPSIAIEKTASQSSYDQAGEVITYTFTVENTGNVTLSNVKVTDPLNGLSSISPSSITSLAPGATGTFTATYTITQADLDAGQVTNTATATGTFGETDYSDTDAETITAEQSASIAIEKTDSQSSYNQAGEVITYTFTVENTGNVTLSNVKVTDPLSGLGPITPSSIPSLAPGATGTFTATYTIT